MRDRLELNGMVLSGTTVGDYDKRLVILTKERGKITAFAKSARKPNSPYLGVCEPFNFGTFVLTEGYDAYHLVGAEIREHFLDVKNDIEGICYGTYFCEVLEYLCVDGVGDAEVLNLAYVALRALTKKDMDNKLARRIFELRVLALEGYGMSAFSCVSCASKEVAAFYPAGNGLVCKSCADKVNAEIHLQETSVYTLQYILSAPLGKLFAFCLDESVLREIDRVIDMYFARHVSRKFKSLEILDSLS